MENQKQSTYRIALYSRLALYSEDEMVAQCDMIRDFAKKQGFENCKEYCDNGYGGLNLDRPAFAELEKDIDAGKVTTIIVKGIDRIARNFVLTSEWLNRTEEKGVKVIAADDSHKPSPYTLEVVKFLKERGIRHESLL